MGNTVNYLHSLFASERFKTALAAIGLLAIGVVFTPLGLMTYRDVSNLSARGVAEVADVTSYRLEETRQRRNTKTYQDKFTIVYGSERQHTKEVALPVDSIISGTANTGTTITVGDQEVRNPQFHILYLSDKPDVVMAGEKGDAFMTLINKNGKLLTLLIGLVGGPLGLILGAVLGFKAIRMPKQA